MPNLDVEGATLYYETVGDGPVLLCVTGASGTLEFWQPLAEKLKDTFTVVRYDRRGFSRSYLTGAQNYAERINTDADDVAAVLKHVTSSSPDSPAYVIGNSSGALVSLVFLSRHPDLPTKVIAHEPPIQKLLPGFEETDKRIQNIYKIYREKGVLEALEVFARAGGMDDNETAGLKASMDSRYSGPYASGNAMYWFERELPAYGHVELDVAALEKAKDKLILVNGKDTEKGAGHFRANEVLAEKVGLRVGALPGAHLGAVSHAGGWAEGVRGLLLGGG